MLEMLDNGVPILNTVGHHENVSAEMLRLFHYTQRKKRTFKSVQDPTHQVCGMSAIIILHLGSTLCVLGSISTAVLPICTK